MKILKYIKQFHLEKILGNILAHIHLKKYVKGEYIFNSSKEVNGIYFVVKGEVEVSSYLFNGRHLFINTLVPLEIFGDVEYLSSDRAMFDVVATKDTTVILLPFNIIDKYLSNNPYFLEVYC